jgi:hypothetical protein
MQMLAEGKELTANGREFKTANGHEDTRNDSDEPSPNRRWTQIICVHLRLVFRFVEPLFASISGSSLASIRGQ